MLSAGSEIVYGVCNNFKRERGEGRERARDKERERERGETDGAVVQMSSIHQGVGQDRERERDETDGAVVQCRLSIRRSDCQPTPTSVYFEGNLKQTDGIRTVTLFLNPGLERKELK